MSDVRIVNDSQNQGPVVAANVRSLIRGNALLVAQVNVSGDIVNPGGGGSSGGNGAIQDGSNSSILATVKSYLNSNPLAVVLVNSSGDAYNGNQTTVTLSKWNLTPTQDTVNVQSGQIGVTGDVAVKVGTTIPAGVYFPVSGDQSISDGVSRGTKATVRGYTRSNPIAVALVNASGDDYAPVPKKPVIITIAGRLTSAGSNQLVAAVSGRKIKVTRFELQADGSNSGNSRGYFASGASGSQLGVEWEFGAREGTLGYVSAVGDGYILSTVAGAALSFELTGGGSTAAMKYAVGYHAEDAL